MQTCSEEFQIVELLREHFNELNGIETKLEFSIACKILQIIHNTYHCLEDVIYEHCGHETITAISLIKINILKFAVIEGCTICGMS